MAVASVFCFAGLLQVRKALKIGFRNSNNLISRLCVDL
jgi:hypothetical protein